MAYRIRSASVLCLVASLSAATVASIITAAPRLHLAVARQGLNASAASNGLACVSLAEIVLSCEAATPGFTTLPPSQELDCLCFQSGAYMPTVFDNYYDSCLTYLSTAKPSIYSASFGGDAGPRNLCGSATPTTSAPTTSIATQPTAGGFTQLEPTPTATGNPSTTSTLTRATGNGVEPIGIYGVYRTVLVGVAGLMIAL
jgi:hypothetical protein